MANITKRFDSVVALDQVSLQVEGGSIHALVGENGAGKTTLMRILYGAIRADSGNIHLNGNPCHFRNSADAIRNGLGMVSQHYAIIGELDCLDNLILGAEPGVVMNRAGAQARADHLAKQMGFEFDWQAMAESLSPAAAQKLEILKLLWRNSQIMILDEPTAMLSPADSDALYASLQRLAKDGATIIVVTHRLPEVMSYCKNVTVLRGGTFIASMPVAETNANDLAEKIVGHALAAPPERHSTEGNKKFLRVRQLSAKGHRGDLAIKDLNFAIQAGEIVGIAGVDGSGQRELFRTLLGHISPTYGEIACDGEGIENWTPQKRLDFGIAIIPEDRHDEGVIEEWSLIENAALGHQRHPDLCSGSSINAEGQRQLADSVAKRFQTKFDHLNQAMRGLSGGNQQRFVAARALAKKPKLVLAFQPARGLDIDATANVYAGFREEAKRGAAVLVVSFDLDELLEHCDRIVVMNSGKLSEPPAEKALDRETIGRLMVGAQ